MIDHWPVDPRAPHEPLLYLTDGPLGHAFVSKEIVTPSGRTNAVTATADDTAHWYTVFLITRDVVFFVYDPTGEIAAGLRPTER